MELVLCWLTMTYVQCTWILPWTAVDITKNVSLKKGDFPLSSGTNYKHILS